MADTSQILTFPIQLVEPDDAHLLDEKETRVQARLHAIAVIERIRDGRMPAEEKTIQSLKNVNRLLLEYGESPVDLSGLGCGN